MPGRHRDEQARVLGPYWVAPREEWRLIVIHTPSATRTKDRQTTLHYRTEDEAKQAKVEHEADICNVTVERAIDAYERHLVDKGTIGYAETIRRIRSFFPEHEMLLSRVTPDRGKKWYDAFRERTIENYKNDGTPAKDHGRPISVAYHRGTLINSRSMLTFCVDEMKWLRTNPLATVKGLGRRKSGKRKPTGNELGQWFACTWPRVEAGDRTALGCMMAFSMALRSSDLTRRLVRDVDLDGTQLNIEDAKSEKSNEPRLIPDKLQPFVRQLIAGRAPTEPLFQRRLKGRLLHLTRRWLEQGQERFCARAGVPYFPPHSLKSASGTVLAKRGAGGNVVMDHMSHEDEATTFRHYVDRGLVESSQAEQAFRLIAGGMK